MVFQKYGQRILVREYHVKYCKSIKILENGDIECPNGNDQIPPIIKKLDGVLREYHSERSGKYFPFKAGRFFPEQFPQPRQILDDATVQNAYLCSKAAYNEESTSKTFINECGRFADSESFTFEKQQIIFALSKDGKKLYIGFKGSGDPKVAFEDWLVNLDIALVDSNAMRSLGADGSVKVHQGFHKRANILIRCLLGKLKDQRYQSVEKVITCGHSLGAAIAAMVHLEFASQKVHDPTITQEFLNITFALPMFGNLALKKFIGTKPDVVAFKKMHHFVNAADVVPAACFIQDLQAHAKNTLGWKKNLMLSFAQNTIPEPILRYLLRHFLKIETLTDEQDQFVRSIVHELKIRNVDPKKLVAENNPEVCIPIGKYLIFHEGKLYNYPDDHQWIAQTLLTSLRTKPADINTEHSLDDYGKQLAICYTNRRLQTFNDWKIDTEAESTNLGFDKLLILGFLIVLFGLWVQGFL